MCNLPFRGHRETRDSTQRGNFLNIIDLLAKYDHLLNVHLSEKRIQKYLSPKIQNELIAIIGSRIKENIVKNIRKCSFFSIVLDTTQDISKKDQLSIIIRHVTTDVNDNNEPDNIRINETFLGIIEAANQTAKSLESDVLNFLNILDINLTKCRGQGYDGAVNMSGAYGGLQKLTKDKQPRANYVHCSTHNLNLVLNDACNNVPHFEKKRHRKVRQFFDDFNADEKLQDRERLFEVDVFKANVDVITQLKNLFESMNGIYKSFSFLSTKNIVSTTNDILYNEASNLQKVYSLDLSSEFPNQIMSLKAVFSEDLIKLNSIKDLGNFLMIQNKLAAPSLPDVCVAVLFFLTLPVTSAMAERSFSKLKLIKKYLRCTMSEERLSYLSLISIEQQEARKFELDEFITDFAKKNVRRQSLFFCDLLLECSAVCILASSACREQPNELVTFVVQPEWYCERILFVSMLSY
ncbi:zinc finger MYM-type protein 1 [Trichonephila clavipes]|nr:zinc finger MYM-type protein 1 [Trichonephila clavipes]